jgi:hypothetical protein
MKSFNAKPWLLPQPVLIIGTYDENGVPNAMNAAWAGQANMNLITYDPIHFGYIALGERFGQAYSEGKKLK